MRFLILFLLVSCQTNQEKFERLKFACETMSTSGPHCNPGPFGTIRCNNAHANYCYKAAHILAYKLDDVPTKQAYPLYFKACQAGHKKACEIYYEFCKGASPQTCVGSP